MLASSNMEHRRIDIRHHPGLGKHDWQIDAERDRFQSLPQILGRSAEIGEHRPIKER